jgi:charged multivesicular body protein 4
MWSTLFGGGAAANKKKQDEAKNAIVKLREQVNMLEKKEAHLQKQIDDLTATAKRNVTTNKKGVCSLLFFNSILCPVWGRSTRVVDPG